MQGLMGDSELTEARVIAEGGWHPGYAQVLAISTDSRLLRELTAEGLD
jgi:hypothetical protein